MTSFQPNPRSILVTLSATPNGTIDPRNALTFDELGRHLKKYVGTDAEKERNDRHILRDQIFNDGGTKFMESVIDDVYDDAETKRKRKKWIRWSRFSNPLKRVVNEMSTVYADPAKRSVTDPASNVRYQALLAAVSMDERMFHVSRLLNLHRALLVRFRVRVLPDGSREPLVEWATPSNVRAVLHPNDTSLVIGWLVRASFQTARPSTVDVPAWTLWTDHECMHLRSDMQPIVESYKEHGFGLNPWVPISLSPPESGFWPGESGEDLVSAAVSMWLQALFMLKESKSATKKTFVTGENTNTQRGQSGDSESPGELGEGQGLQTVDNSMDISMFRDNGDHILGHVAQNHGLAAPLVNNQGVQSAAAREALRIPLKEIRKHQLIPIRRAELMLMLVMAVVCVVDLPEYAFDPTGWLIEFGEWATPLTRNEETDLFVKERQAGIDNTLDLIARRKQCNEDQARAAMERNIEVEAERNFLMRPLEAISGSLGAPTPVAPVVKQQPPNAGRAADDAA